MSLFGDPAVEVVVINWKRPRNVARIVHALRNQSVRPTITIVDCHPNWRYHLSKSTLAKADRVYRQHRNLGSFNRYVPLGAYDHEFTYFADDDMLPGSRCIEHFLDTKPHQFGVLGQIGRRLNADGSYSRRGVTRTGSLEQVDFLIRGYFVPTSRLDCVNRLRWQLNLQKEPSVEDDMLLSVSMDLIYGLDSLLSPASDDSESKQNKLELKARHALAKRPDHFDRRVAFIEQAKNAGWQPKHGLGWSSEGQDQVPLRYHSQEE